MKEGLTGLVVYMNSKDRDYRGVAVYDVIYKKLLEQQQTCKEMSLKQRDHEHCEGPEGGGDMHQHAGGGPGDVERG